eukprot:GHVR01020318.1.p1 GENE.GHVR01020318.1~~GHVR01020318.1.p1  ORF type:complete len:404 (+),score=66.17 GHVR01020318.1:317-1528(+)
MHSSDLCFLIERAMGPSLALQCVSPQFNRLNEKNSWVMNAAYKDLASYALMSNNLSNKWRCFLEGVADKPLSLSDNDIKNISTTEDTSDTIVNIPAVVLYLVGLVSTGNINSTLSIIKTYKDIPRTCPSLLFLAMYHSVLHKQFKLLYELSHYLNNIDKDTIIIPQISDCKYLFYYNIYSYIELNNDTEGLDVLINACPPSSRMQWVTLHGLDDLLLNEIIHSKHTIINYNERVRHDSLELACHMKRLSTALIIINNTGGIEWTGYMRMTPLMYGVSHNFTKLVEVLIAQGANVNAATCLGKTPLHFVRKVEICQILLDAGASVDIPNDDLCTPLQVVCMGPDVQLQTLLISKGADVNTVSRDGSSCLHGSVSVETTQLLIEKGAFVNHRSRVCYIYMQVVPH